MRNGGETTTRAATIFVRAAGLLIAATSITGAGVVIAKLYTGRGGTMPIRTAIHEQPLIALAGLVGLALGVYIAICPREFTAARRWLNPRWVWRERKAEAALLAISSLLAFGLLEVGSRALYMRDERLPFFFPPEHLVYPALYHAMKDYDPAAKNVLLLGGSVLYGAGRGRTLEHQLGPGWRVYNLAANAHSSLDSLTKYRYLLDHGYRFDYVLFYHAINEVRANNAPPEVFRADYSHYLYYRLVHAIFRTQRPVLRTALHSALVYRANGLITQLRETRTFGRHFVNIAYPREDWLKYGSDIKSAASFEVNLLAIADLADRRRAQMLASEFAYDPRLDDFVQGRPEAPARDWMIAYTKEWGLPENVQKGMAAHNTILRAHADRYRFFATDSLKHRECFVDPCHFAPQASEAFMDLLVSEILTADRAREGRALARSQ